MGSEVVNQPRTQGITRLAVNQQTWNELIDG